MSINILSLVLIECHTSKIRCYHNKIAYLKEMTLLKKFIFNSEDTAKTQ